MSEPGKQYAYSNLGMGLLGQVLATRVGKSYPDLLNDRIARPLGLADTTVALSKEQEGRFATPSRDRLEMQPWRFGALCGCGGVRSTVNDMLKFIDLTLKAKGTKPEGPLAEALRVVTERQTDNMGLGWHIAGDGSTLYHMGQTGGFSAGLLISPLASKAVVVLANSATAHVDVLAEQLIPSMFGMNVPARVYPKEVPVEAKAIARFVGTYACPAFEIEITVRGGGLFAQITGQTPFGIFPTSKTRFFYRDIAAELEFSAEAEGESPATGVSLHQNGRVTRCVRKEAAKGE